MHFNGIPEPGSVPFTPCPPSVITHINKVLPSLFLSRLKVPSVSPHMTATPIPPCSSMSMSGTGDARTGPSTLDVSLTSAEQRGSIPTSLHLLVTLPGPARKLVAFLPHQDRLLAPGHHGMLQTLLHGAAFPAGCPQPVLEVIPSQVQHVGFLLDCCATISAACWGPSEGQHNHLVHELLLWALHDLQTCWESTPCTARQQRRGCWSQDRFLGWTTVSFAFKF